MFCNYFGKNETNLSVENLVGENFNCSQQVLTKFHKLDKVTNDSNDMIIWYRFSTVWTLPCLGCEIWNIQREVFTNSLNTYLMPCKDIT